MAYQYLTLADVAKSNLTDRAAALIEENLNAAPELDVLPANAIDGTKFTSLVRTAYPTTGFRQLNTGVEPTKSTYVNKTFEMFYYDGQMEMDVGIAAADQKGIDHALAMEETGHGRAFLLTGGKQVWYGNTASGDANGFPGAVSLVDSGLVIDAGGTTDNLASSVYAVVADPNFFELLISKTAPPVVAAWRKQTITRNSKEMTAWKNSLEGYVGAAWYSKYACARIKKLTAETGKGCTDSLLAQLLATFPIGVRPTHIFMSRRSRQQLQIQRTVSLFGDTSGKIPVGKQGNIAPTPTEYEGVPIIATDSILNTETLAL